MLFAIRYYHINFWLWPNSASSAHTLCNSLQGISMSDKCYLYGRGYSKTDNGQMMCNTGNSLRDSKCNPNTNHWSCHICYNGHCCQSTHS